MDRFSAHFEILPASQQALLPHLARTPSRFVLFGGTAIALRLGHRKSIDFDYFSGDSFVPGELLREIDYLQDAEVTQRAPNTLSVLLTPDGVNHPVNVSFFGDLDLQIVEPPQMTSKHNLQVASLIDLLATKCATITDRVEAKDYLDIHAIVTRSMWSLSDGIGAAATMYGKQYNPLVTLKTLQYFEGGDLNSLSSDVKQDLCDSVIDVQLESLPSFSALGKIAESL